MKTTKLLFLLIGILSLNHALAQSTQPDYWENLLLNNREVALEEVKKAHKQAPALETLLAREIIQIENGIFTKSKNFVPEFLTYGKEEYIYPLWNQSFFFGDYIKVGFNDQVIQTVDQISAAPIKVQTLKEGLIYMNAIVARHENDFSNYRLHNRKLSSIKKWQYCGVFENLNGSGLDAVYGPEKFAKSAENFDANSNGAVNWFSHKFETYEGYIMIGNHDEFGSGVNYMQTFITNPSARKASIRVGCSAKFKVWLNDVLIYENSKLLATDLDAYSVEVNLPAGENRLLLKVAGNGNDYAIVRVTDENGLAFNDLVFDNVYKEYQKSTQEEINPQMQTFYFETYFKKLRDANPNNFLYDYLLMNTYIRNGRHEQVKEILMPLLERYPTSSILRQFLMNVHVLEKDYTSSREVLENINQDDENYYVALTSRFQDVQELFRMSMVDMEAFLNRYAKSVDLELIKISAKTLLSLRKEDVSGLRNNLDQLINLSLDTKQIGLAKIYIPLYGSVLNDEEKSIKMLEKLNKSYFDFDMRQRLMNYYDKQNKPEKVLKLMKQNVLDLDLELEPLSDLALYLQAISRYEESIVYADKMLDMFPYSFNAMSVKADGLLQLGRVEEALKWYEKSLIYNGENMTTRQKISDLKEEVDMIEKHKIQEVYKYIAANRAKAIANNYGYNLLVDEAVIELYSEAGGKGRYTMLFEVTAEKGIEYLKEYNLGLSGNYDIVKSEIVKKNGSITPAERAGSSLVFANLEVNDVIYIDYQVSFSGLGRFYRDFEHSYQFDGYHPCLNSTYKLILPNGKKVDYFVSNGELPHEVETGDSHTIHTWTSRDFAGVDRDEPYMPEMVDFTRILYVSTIKSWNNIANWYSDLVRSQMIVNADVEKVFKELFPEEDITTISQRERAKRIYYYIAKNMNYSSVSFRQSGFVPQKPEKTITSKLGDCKDFSTLFVSLARLAKLDANLVLVLTTDTGSALELPSQDFNHCIAKVLIDDSTQYLELTDKYLPFAALPTSLRGCSILEIPYQSNEEANHELKRMTKPRRAVNSYTNEVKLKIAGDVKSMEIQTSVTGSSRAYVSQVLNQPNYELILQDVSNSLESAIGSNVVVDSVYEIHNVLEDDTLSYKTNCTINGKVNKIGSFKILELPTISHAYTNDIISEKTRKYPINYLRYENVDTYTTIYNVYLEEGQEFSEIPENISLTYKAHSYDRTFKILAPNHLLVTVISSPDEANISPSEYVEFKDYVQKILDGKEEFIGYK